MPDLIKYELHNVLIVDDHPLIRFAVSEILSQHFIECQSGIHIHEAGDSEMAIRLAGELSGCLALVDLCIPNVSGMELIRKLRLANREMPILVLSMQDEQVFAERSLLAGANGYLMKTVKKTSLIRAIQCVCRGNIWLSEGIKNTLFSKAAGAAPAQISAILLLSKRELEIFEHIGQGLSRLKITALTGLSNNTIESYRKNIKMKLGLKDFSELNKAAFLHMNGNSGGCHD